jgi:hypothetical protein
VIVSFCAQNQHAAARIVSLTRSGYLASRLSHGHLFVGWKGLVNPMATPQMVVLPKQTLNALLAAASIEQDSAKLSELTEAILAAFAHGESVSVEHS